MKRYALMVAALGLAACQAPAPVTPPGATPSFPATPDASVSPSPVVATNTLSGVVYDDDSNPLAGISVEIFAGDVSVGKAETGADGRYVLAVPAGQYRVKASKAGMASRDQGVNVQGETSLNFGGLAGRDVNPYFMATYPEISSVDVKEEAPGGPFTMTVQFSEPLTAESRRNFLELISIQAPNEQPFLRPNLSVEPEFKLDSAWDDAGQSLTLKYDEPYLASGVENATYTLRIRQKMKDEKDPVTRENLYEDMRVTDADGKALGKGRADYAFRMQTLTLFPGTFLTDKTYGYAPADRRWNLTHTSSFSFTAKKDDIPPGLTSVKVDVRRSVGSKQADVMELRFTEPMRVVKNQDEPQFTRLDADKALKDLMIVNVSKDASGNSAEPLGSAYKVDRFRFSKTDPTVVYADFAAGAFEKMNWVEVTLGNEMRDPGNNKPDPAKVRAAGVVVGSEEK